MLMQPKQLRNLQFHPRARAYNCSNTRLALFGLRPPFGGFQQNIAYKRRYVLLACFSTPLDDLPRIVIHAKVAHGVFASSRATRTTFRRFFCHEHSLGPDRYFVNLLVFLDKGLDLFVMYLYILGMDLNNSSLQREKTMEPREQRGLVIAATSRKIRRKGDNLWLVPSQAEGRGNAVHAWIRCPKCKLGVPINDYWKSKGYSLGSDSL